MWDVKDAAWDLCESLGIEAHEKFVADFLAEFATTADDNVISKYHLSERQKVELNRDALQELLGMAIALIRTNCPKTKEVQEFLDEYGSHAPEPGIVIKKIELTDEQKDGLSTRGARIPKFESNDGA